MITLVIIRDLVSIKDSAESSLSDPVAKIVPDKPKSQPDTIVSSQVPSHSIMNIIVHKHVVIVALWHSFNLCKMKKLNVFYYVSVHVHV